MRWEVNSCLILYLTCSKCRKCRKSSQPLDLLSLAKLPALAALPAPQKKRSIRVVMTATDPHKD